MFALAESVREVVSWKTKASYDTVSDQYTRVFMPKLFIVSSLFMAFSYFNDKLNCLVSDRLHSATEFVQETCWIQGFYIYKDMHNRLNQSAYYGIPEYMSYDGIDNYGDLCAMKDHAGGRRPNCKPMTKRYFLHYQWLPFFVCSLVIVYYAPYQFFRLANADLISLVDQIRFGVKDVDKMVSNYFNYRVNSKWKMKVVIWVNLLIKKIYLLVNFGGLLITDQVLDGRFLTFGFKWYTWNQYPDHIAHDISKRNAPKPGDFLIPSVGICDIHETLTNKRGIYVDKHRIVCEISQNIRYQYIFVIIWFFSSVGVIVSGLGLVHYIFTISKAMFWLYRPEKFLKKSFQEKVTAHLTIREMEYLDKIKGSDLTVYGEILRSLAKYRPNFTSVKKYSVRNGNTLALLPTAPKTEQEV